MSCPCHTCPDAIVCVCHTCPSVSHLPLRVLSACLYQCHRLHWTCVHFIISVHVTPVLITSSPLDLSSFYHLCSCHTCFDLIVSIHVTTALMSTSPCYTCSDAIVSIHVRPVLMSSSLFMSDPFWCHGLCSCQTRSDVMVSVHVRPVLMSSSLFDCGTSPDHVHGGNKTAFSPESRLTPCSLPFAHRS